MLCTRTIVWLADGQSSHSVDLLDGVALRPGSTRETDMEIRQIGGCYSVLFCTMRRPGQAHGSYSTHALSYLPLVRPTCAHVPWAINAAAIQPFRVRECRRVSARVRNPEAWRRSKRD